MLNAEAVVALIFGVVVLSVFAFIGFPVLNQHKRIDAVLGALWNSTPIKGIRRLVVGVVWFLLAIYLAVFVYSLSYDSINFGLPRWLQWIAYVKQSMHF